MSQRHISYSTKAHEALLNGDYSSALELYLLAENEVGKGIFDANIDICRAALGEDEAFDSFQDAASEYKLTENSVRGILASELSVLKAEAAPLLLVLGYSLDKIETSGVISQFRHTCPKGTVCVVLRKASTQKALNAAKRLGADEVYVPPFEAEDEFWVNYVLNQNEYTRALGVNFSRGGLDSMLARLDVVHRGDRSLFGIATSGFALFSLSAYQTKECGGFFIPLEGMAACLSYLLRLEVRGVLPGGIGRRVFSQLSYSETSPALAIARKVTFDLIEQGGGFVKPLDVLQWLASYPEGMLGKSSTLLALYGERSSVEAPVDVYCFDAFLNRSGISRKIKHEEFHFLDGLEKPKVKVLTNSGRSGSLQASEALLALSESKELLYVDLLPLRTYEVSGLDFLLATGKTPITVQVPVIRRIPCQMSPKELYELSTKEQFGSISACFNNGSTLCASLLSVVAQSVSRLEVNVVDDCSADDGLALANGFLSLFPYADKRITHSPLNQGVYPSRNVAIIKSRASYLFGQDLDDHSTPQRVFLSNVLLKESGKDFLVTRHARCDSGTNLLSMKKGSQPLQLFRKGLMTWHTKRSTYFTYGLFSHVRKSGDSEFYDRVKRLGKGVVDAPLNTYFALMDEANEGRLTSDIFSVGGVDSPLVYEFNASEARAQFERDYKNVHKELKAPFNHFGGNVVSRNEAVRVEGSVATIPGRESQFSQALRSILGQVDQINVFLNGPVNVEHPDLASVIDDGRVHLFRSSHVGDLRDNAKFFLARERQENTYYFTFDDDLIYPEDYVDTFLYKSSLYSDSKVLCVHGYRLWPHLKSIHTDSQKRGRYYHFKEPLIHDVVVDVPGTGTVMIPPGAPIQSFDSPPYGMIDVVFAEFCARQDCEIVSIARPLQWIKEAKSDEAPDQRPVALFKQNQANDREEQIRTFVSSIQEQQQQSSRKVPQALEREGESASLKYSLADEYDRNYFSQFGRKLYICCTGYNYESFANKFARSLFWAVRNTNFLDVEVLFYDDGSTDGSVDVLIEFLRKNFTAWPVTVFKGLANQGPAFGRAFLAEQVAEEDAVCLFLDSDDEVSPSIIRRVIAEYVAHPDTMGTFGGWMFNDVVKKPWPSHTRAELAENPASNNVFKFGHPRTLVKSAYTASDKRLFFTPDGRWLKYCSDLGLFLGVLANVNISQFRRIDDILYYYNVGTSNGTMARFGADKRLMRDYLFYVYRQIEAGAGASLPNPYAYRVESDFKSVEKVYCDNA
ncbi:glycosyltransferase family A protein [Marinimicrobium agarilyticum]|uniref:glycosyltransferase family A protein n=1 Tax=Marinimicrobium agarilyticum TaxID=306546 RepID=UPI0004128831|nr:glycosyltransferase family A protein [Marinimicrobium agarilyticum]